MNVATLKKRVETASQLLQKALQGMGSSREELGRIMAAPDPDEQQADAIQARIEALGREAERRRLEVAALEEQLPAARRQEAAAKLKTIAQQHAPLVTEAEELRRELEDLLPRAEQAAVTLKERKRQAQDLVEEAEFLSWRHELDAPALDALSDLEVEASIGHRLRQLIAGSRPAPGVWNQRLQDAKRQAKQDAKQAARAAEGERDSLGLQITR